MNELVKRYLDAWNMRDSAARRRAIDALFADGCSYTDPMGAVSGPAGVDGFIAAVQKQFEGVTFVLDGRVDAHHDVARFSWHAVVKGATVPVAIGFDVVVLEEGRIKQIIGFLDKAPG